MKLNTFTFTQLSIFKEKTFKVQNTYFIAIYVCHLIKNISVCLTEIRADHIPVNCKPLFETTSEIHFNLKFNSTLTVAIWLSNVVILVKRHLMFHQSTDSLNIYSFLHRAVGKSCFTFEAAYVVCTCLVLYQWKICQSCL